MQPLTLQVQVVDVQGNCPAYKVGDAFRIVEGYKLVAEIPLCMHALQSLAPYYVALSRGVDPADLGLAGPDGAAYVQCLDPQEVTGGGTVVFRVTVPRSQIVRHHLYERTLVRWGATIGANATVVCGVTIGRYAFVGAGAVVCRDVPDYALMLGVPARQRGCKGAGERGSWGAREQGSRGAGEGKMEGGKGKGERTRTSPGEDGGYMRNHGGQIADGSLYNRKGSG